MYQKSEPLNLKACIVIQHYRHYVVISQRFFCWREEQLVPSNNHYKNLSSKLVIERQTGRVIETKDPTEIIGDQKIEKRYGFSLFLGILTIYDQQFLLFAAEASKVSTIDGSDVFSIHQAACLGFEVPPFNFHRFLCFAKRTRKFPSTTRKSTKFSSTSTTLKK